MLICREDGKESIFESAFSRYLTRLQLYLAGIKYIANPHFSEQSNTSQLNTGYLTTRPNPFSETAKHKEPHHQDSPHSPLGPDTRRLTRTPTDLIPIQRPLHPKRSPPNGSPIPVTRLQHITPRVVAPTFKPNRHIPTKIARRTGAAPSSIRPDSPCDLQRCRLVVEARRHARVVPWGGHAERAPVVAGLDEATVEDDGVGGRALRVREVQELGEVGSVAVAGEGVRG